MKSKKVLSAPLQVLEGGEQRLDKFLQTQFSSRSEAGRIISDGLVRVNGKQETKKSFRLSQGDAVEIDLSAEHAVANQMSAANLQPEDVEFGVVYEDEHLAVIDKPAGVCVHPGNGQTSGTLVSGLLKRFGDNLANLDTVRPGIVHRLDQDTSGLMMIAKRDEVAVALSKMFALRQISKSYLALVLGNIEPPEGRIENMMARSKKDFRKMGVYQTGKLAISEYQTCESYDFFSLVKVRILTGRTHQIRVHLAHLGHPILADKVYGSDKNAIMRVPPSYAKKMKHLLKNHLLRTALHSHLLGFEHPISAEKMSFTSDLPADMLFTIDFFKKNFEHYSLLDR